MKYVIIEQTKKYGANEIECKNNLDDAENCIANMKENSLDPYYDDLIASGGYLWIDHQTDLQYY